MLRENSDYLYLIWKSKTSRRQYIIGVLSHECTRYKFQYCQEAWEAEKEGFVPLVAFPDLDCVYYSKELFSVFESRLPDKKRKDMQSILKKYELQEYEPYQLLKRSGGRLPIDDLYFVDPICALDEPFKRKFYIAGVRHYAGCEGVDCEKSIEVEIGEEITLEPEPTNKVDKNAVKVLKKDCQILGYIPRFYSAKVCELIKEKRKWKCTVINVEKNKNCDECVKILLEVK